MLATFVLEIALAIYTVWRYKLNKVSRLVVAILVCLAVFQLAEYVVCEGAFGMSGATWSRIGFVSITLLPPLGLHLATILAGKKRLGLLWGAYGTGVAFVLFFALAPAAITNHICQGNYVIFGVAPGSLWLYIFFYYGWLIAATALCFRWAAQHKVASHRTALRALAVGYLAFLLPTTAANLLDSSTMAGLPSIMCGFAVLLALALVGWVLPSAQHADT